MLSTILNGIRCFIADNLFSVEATSAICHLFTICPVLTLKQRGQWLLGLCCCMLSILFQGPSWTKDKNYSVGPSTHDAEESNDGENEEGRRGRRVKERRRWEKVIRKSVTLQRAKFSMSKTTPNRIRKRLSVNQGHCSAEFMTGSKIRHKVLGKYKMENT